MAHTAFRSLVDAVTRWRRSHQLAALPVFTLLNQASVLL